MSFTPVKGVPGTLRDQITQTFIIACEEDTQLLERSLTQEGIQYQVLRQQPIDPSLGYSRSYLCLMNHVRAWERIAASGQAGLIIEADFVPVEGFGNLPLPCDVTKPTTGIAWLYTCAPQIYSVTDRGYAEGFSVSTVAYLVTASSAERLLLFAARVRLEYGEYCYTPWDSRLEEALRNDGFTNYIPFRNYGEHGGIPNPEHWQNRQIWKQFSAVHRADTLYGKLSFRPIYARTNWEFWQIRSYARLKGVGRLFSGRLLRLAIVQRSSVPWRLIRFALIRQLF